MSNTMAAPNKPQAAWTQLDKQLNQAKSLLRQMCQTVEDMLRTPGQSNGPRARTAKSRASPGHR